MTLNFPSSPTNGQTYSLANGATYTWDGEKWKASNIPDSSDVVQTTDTPANGEVLKWDNGAAVWDTDNDTTYTVGDGGLTQNNFTTTLKDKLDGIEDGADVTDATNVAAAGAVMEGDTTTANMSFVVDEDNMSSNSATKVPTQQSVKAYVDNEVANAGGGLTEFTEADNEAAPNAPIHVSSLTSNAGSPDADVAIVPKGAGAFLAAVPDNTTNGGNKRGFHAVDLQTTRLQSDRVASGNFSVISGGWDNKTSGSYSTVSGGYENNATSNYSAVLGGRGNDSTGDSAVSCGDNALASGLRSVAISGEATGALAIAIGDGNVADASRSTCIGGYRGDTKGRKGVFVIPAGYNSSYGDAQYQIQNVKKKTTDATQTTLHMETQVSSASVWNTFRLAVNQMHVIKGTCVAAKSDYSLVKAWDFTAVVKWENGTTAPVIVGTPNINVLMEETNSAAWDISLDILTYSTTVASFVVNVTGQAGTTIDWLCTLHSTELNTL
jgi:hypothetical protein